MKKIIFVLITFFMFQAKADIPMTGTENLIGSQSCHLVNRSHLFRAIFDFGVDPEETGVELMDDVPVNFAFFKSQILGEFSEVDNVTKGVEVVKAFSTLRAKGICKSEVYEGICHARFRSRYVGIVVSPLNPSYVTSDLKIFNFLNPGSATEFNMLLQKMIDAGLCTQAKFVVQKSK